MTGQRLVCFGSGGSRLGLTVPAYWISFCGSSSLAMRESGAESHWREIALALIDSDQAILSECESLVVSCFEL